MLYYTILYILYNPIVLLPWHFLPATTAPDLFYVAECTYFLTL